MFNGPRPVLRVFETIDDEAEAVGGWVEDRKEEGVLPHEIGIFVRSDDQFERAEAAVRRAGLAIKVLDEHVETNSGYVSISRTHVAKGLEFRAVAVMACDDEVIPLRSGLSRWPSTWILRTYTTPNVTYTRARDQLLVTSVELGSEFLDDLRA